MSIWDNIQHILQKLYIDTDLEFYDLRVRHLLGLWDQLKGIAPIYVSRKEMKILFTALKNYAKISVKDLPAMVDFASSPLTATATTSTSSTPAQIQTVLVAVPRSREVHPSEGSESLDLNEEFTCLTSRFQTGKTSLDISLQLDTQSKTLKAEVEMMDYVYD